VQLQSIKVKMLAPILASLGAALGAALPSHNNLNTRQSGPSAFATNSDGSLQLSSIAAPVQGAGTGGASTWALSIDDTPSGYKQTITGFGAAVTDATVTSFTTGLSSDSLNSLLNELMTSAGADFTLMRHTIGASDLSGDPAYTYDDNGNNADPNFNGFNLGDRGYAMAQMLAKMKSLKPDLTIFGSPWSPPGWMKLNGVIDGTSTNNNLNDGYLTNNGPQYSSAFAEYFVKYIQAYESQGAHIDAITIQNEPLNSQAGYPTMYMFDYEQADLIQNYIGPALANAGLNTKVWAYDHNTGMLISHVLADFKLTDGFRCAFIPSECHKWSWPVRRYRGLALLRHQPQLGCLDPVQAKQPQRHAIHDRMLDPRQWCLEPSRRLHHGSSPELGVRCRGLDSRHDTRSQWPRRPAPILRRLCYLHRLGQHQ